MIGLSAYLYFAENGYDLSAFSWGPVICLAFVVFISSAGIIPLSHVCRVENLPTKVLDIDKLVYFCRNNFSIVFICVSIVQIRAVGLALCIFMLNIFAFVCAKLFPLLIDIIGLHGCMMIFAFNCIVGSFFIFFVVDETRGKHMDQVKAEPPRTEPSRA